MMKSAPHAATSPILRLAMTLVGLIAGVAAAQAADSPQWGGSATRNHVAEATNIPTDWDVGQFDENTDRWLESSARNIRWVARLGSQTYGTPVVAGGKVICATNNGAGWLKRYPAAVDLGCLVCFQESNGSFLWQLSCEKLAQGRTLDWPKTGICCSPLVEGRRLWVVTNRSEVVCVDMDGAADRPGEAVVLWSFDMIGRLGVVPHNMSSCSVTSAGDLLLVTTANGVDELHKKVPAPDAPSFIALDKRTGKLVWADRSPSPNVMHGQWSSPAFAVAGGAPQAVFAGGDGWVYGFRVGPSATGRLELLWKFDCNPKTSVWKDGGRGDRNTLIATPVIVGDRVYVAVGDDPEFGEGPGRLWCIDATKRPAAPCDVSPTLVVDRQGRPVPPRRLQAADPKAGDVEQPNPASAAVWQYVGRKDDTTGERPFDDVMHRTLGMAVVKDDLVVIADLAGLVHCLDARTGRPHWTYDMKSAVWGSPLVVEGKIYLGDEDGDVAVFELSAKFKLLAKNSVGTAVYTTPVAANDTLYVATNTRLVAIGYPKTKPKTTGVGKP